jgi:hypothetical protein
MKGAAAGAGSTELSALFKRACLLAADLADVNNAIAGVVLLGDCLGRREEAQRAAGELLGVFHRLVEEGGDAKQTILLATVLQKMLSHARAGGVSARVHLGSGCPLAVVVQLWQKEHPAVQAAALELVAEVCLFEDFNAALDATDMAVAIRLLDGAVDSDIRRASLRVLLTLTATTVAAELREKRRSLLIANQLRPRLVALLRTETQPDIQEAAAELLMRVVTAATAPELSWVGEEPGLLTPGPTPMHALTPGKSPGPQRPKTAVAGGNANAPHASPSKTPLAVRKPSPASASLLLEEQCDYSDFVALLGVTGPVAAQACMMLQTSLAAGGAVAARVFRRQRGVERLTALLLDLLEPTRAQVDWCVRARRSGVATLLGVVLADPGCNDCFFESGGTEMAALVLAVDRGGQDVAASLLEAVALRGAREGRYVETLLGAARPATVSKPTGFASQTSRIRLELEACRGVPSDGSRVLLAANSEGFELREAARALHVLCFVCAQSMPSVEALRNEVREWRDEHARHQHARARAQHEQQLLKLRLDAEREREALATKMAVEAAERSARIRNDAESARRKALADVETQAAQQRHAALLEIETQLAVKRFEAERDGRAAATREEAERRVQEMTSKLNSALAELADMRSKEDNYLEQLASQRELIAQLSKVSQELYHSSESSPGQSPSAILKR